MKKSKIFKKKNFRFFDPEKNFFSKKIFRQKTSKNCLERLGKKTFDFENFSLRKMKKSIFGPAYPIL